MIAEDSPSTRREAASAKSAFHERCRSLRLGVDKWIDTELSSFGLAFQELDSFEIEVFAILVADSDTLRYLLSDLFVLDLVTFDDFVKSNHVVKVLLLLLRYCLDVLEVFYLLISRVSLFLKEPELVVLFRGIRANHAHCSVVKAFGGPRHLHGLGQLGASFGHWARLGVRCHRAGGLSWLLILVFRVG